ncbi:hypothetical protein MACJ_004120 [Theileria orientalis]|uniref:Uncharacterized protein n=1 Tax=Theileria orientalis TaxID=68886 RepID=A0A976SL94_THEOR|nr:hypothetical protein MACJ_004120 [Theileria orientalis]
MNRFIFSTIFIFININLINCSDDEADGQTQIPINVDLKSIKSEDFDILESIIEIDPSDEVKLESYKLTPKTNKKINKISFGNVDIWNPKVSKECSNITIHRRNCIYFVIKTLDNNVPIYIYLRLNNSLIGVTGVLSLLYDINYPFLSENVTKPYPLNISSNFDKLYVNHLFKQKGTYRYETFEPNKGETFGMITDNIDTIWVPTQSPMPGLGLGFCKKVRVFKQETYVRNRNDGRLRAIMVYRFLILSLIDGRTEYFKLDPETDKWVNIEINELRIGIKRFVAKNLYYFDSSESSSSDNEADKIEPYVLDILKRNKSIKYGVTNVYPFRIINLYKSDTNRIDEIKYGNQVIIKYNFEMFTMNIFNTRNEWYYVEIVIKSDVDLAEVKELGGVSLSKLGLNLYGIYYSIYDIRKEVENITRNYFLDSLEDYISGYADTDYVKYSNFYELEGGLEASDLSEEIRLKINPNYGKKEKVVPADPVTSDDKPDDSEPADPAPSHNESNAAVTNSPGSSKNTDDTTIPEGEVSSLGTSKNTDDTTIPEGEVSSLGTSKNTDDTTIPEGEVISLGTSKNTDDTTIPEGEVISLGTSKNTDYTNNLPTDFSENVDSDKKNKGKQDEVKDGKVYEKINPHSKSSKIKNDVDDKHHEFETSENGNDATVPKESLQVSVVVQQMVMEKINIVYVLPLNYQDSFQASQDFRF